MEATSTMDEWAMESMTDKYQRWSAVGSRMAFSKAT